MSTRAATAWAAGGVGTAASVQRSRRGGEGASFLELQHLYRAQGRHR